MVYKTTGYCDRCEKAAKSLHEFTLKKFRWSPWGGDLRKDLCDDCRDGLRRWLRQTPQDKMEAGK